MPAPPPAATPDQRRNSVSAHFTVSTPARVGTAVNDDLPRGANPRGAPEIDAFLELDVVTGPEAHPFAASRSQQYGHAIGRQRGAHPRMEMEAEGEALCAAALRPDGGHGVFASHVVSVGRHVDRPVVPQTEPLDVAVVARLDEDVAAVLAPARPDRRGRVAPGA